MANTLSPHRAPFKVVMLSTGGPSHHAWMGQAELDYIVEVEDPDGALFDRLAREPPSAVVVDLSMDDALGLASLRKVRRAFPQLPVVVLTGEDEAAGLQALREGAQDYLPLAGADAPSLERILRNAIERAEAAGALHFETTVAQDCWAARFAIGRLLFRARDAETATPHVLQILCETLAFDVGELWVVDKDAGVLRLATQWQGPGVKIVGFATQSRALTFAANVGLPGRIWASRAPLFIPDVRQDENLPRAALLGQDGLRGACGFPVLAGTSRVEPRGAYGIPVETAEEVLGVLAFFSREPHNAHSDVLLMMASVGTQLGSFLAQKQGEQALAVAQAALLESERTHHRFVEGLNERYFLYRHDRAGRFTYLSPSISRVLGYSPNDYRANYAEMFTDDPCNREAVMRTEATLRGELQPMYEVEVRARNGGVRRLEITEYPVRGSSGQVDSVEGIARDITEQRHVEQALRESEQRYRNLVVLREGQSQVLEMIATGASLEDTLTALVGLIEGQSPGLLASVLLLEEDGVHIRHGAAPSLPREYVEAVDGRSIGPQAGSCGTAMYRHEPVVVTDILTDPLWDDHRSLAAPHGLRACWSTPILSPRGKVLGSLAMYYREVRSPGPAEKELSDVATRIAAIAIERKEVETERQRAHEAKATTYRIAEAATTGEGLEDLLWAVHTNLGELIPARNFFVALRDDTTQLVSFPYWVDERQPRPAPRVPGQLLTDYVLREGIPLHATPETTADLVRRGVVSPRHRPHTDWMGVPLLAGERTIGALVVSSYAESFRFGERDLEVLQFVSTQVAMAIDRRRAEAALRESEATFRSLVENAPYGIFRATPDGRFMSVNPALVRILGHTSKDDLLALDIGRDVHRDPQEHTRVLQAFRERAYVPVEASWKRKDGRPITVRMTGSAVRGEAGAALLYEVIVEDVSERRALEDQLRQAQKIEAVGRLAGGIAHDFNNILNVILGYTELLLRQPALLDFQRDKLDEIRKAGQRAARLTHQLLAFSRKQILKPQVLDLNAVVSEMENMLRRLIGEDVQLVTVLGSALDRVKADPGQMEQVLMNLSVNARDAMPQGGTLLVETANVELGEKDSAYYAGASPGAYVLLSVIDTGDGMDAETLSHIFEPFFTTREQGQGTGLGLATVYGIVKQSGGYITVESRPGKGSVFRVILPRTEEKDVPRRAASAVPLERATETVLLVEDDAALRAVVQEVLEEAGYAVLTRESPEECLALAEAYTRRIDLLLTDVIMPGLNGTEVAERLLEMRPGTRVLYMSGYTDEALVSRAALGRDTPFIQKPFATDSLLRTVREALGGRR